MEFNSLIYENNDRNKIFLSNHANVNNLKSSFFFEWYCYTLILNVQIIKFILQIDFLNSPSDGSCVCGPGRVSEGGPGSSGEGEGEGGP